MKKTDSHPWRLWGILAGVFLLFASIWTLPVLADDEDPGRISQGSGTITVTNGQSGVDYAAYQIFGATYSTSGNVTDGVAYTADARTKDIFESFQAGTVSPNPFVFTPIPGSDLYAVTKREGYSDDVIVQFFNHFRNEIEQQFASQKHTPTSSTPPTVVFSDLPFGYYFVTSSSGAALSLTTAAPSATILEKSQSPVIDDAAKTVQEGNEWLSWSGTSVGDTRRFRIRFSASNYQNDQLIPEYMLTDTSKNLGIDLSSVTLTITPENAAQPSHSWSQAQFSENGIQCSLNDGVLSLTIPWANEQGPLYLPSPNTVELQYSAKVLEPAALNGATNTVDIAFLDTTTESSVNLATYSFILNKYEKTSYENQAPVHVEGAQFTLWDAAEGGHQIYVVANPHGGYLVIGSAQTAPDGKSGTVPITAGQTSVAGLNAGVYYLQEEKVPDGYNPLSGRVRFEVKKDGTNTVDVLNAKGDMLPGTGANSRILIYGAALLSSFVALGLIGLKLRRHNRTVR